jgi:hypothetical protein
MVQEIFNEPFLGKIRPFNGLSTDAAENKRLQIELMKVHINDQYLSANLTNKLLLKYSRDKTEVIIDSVFIYTDAINSERLKVTFKVHGFPTGKLECI